TIPATTTAPSPPSVDAFVDVVIGPRLVSRDDVDAALAGGLPDDPLDGVRIPLVDAVPVGSVYDEDDGTVDVNLRVPTTAGTSAEDDLELPDAGIYPVSIAVKLGEGNTVAEHTTLIHAAPSDVALAAQLRLGVLTTTLGDDSDERLAAITALGERDIPLTVAIDPSRLSELASDDPDVLADLADALRGAESVALPLDGLDPSSAATADLAATFNRNLRAGEGVLERSLPETPVRRTVWPMLGESVSGAGAELLASTGSRMFVIDAALATSLVEGGDVPAGRTMRTPLGLDALSTLAVDDEIASLLEPDGDTSDDLDDSVRLLSWLLIDAPPGARHGVVLTTPDLGVPDGRLLTRMADLVGDATGATFTQLSGLPGVTDEDLVSTIELPAQAGVDLRGRVAAVEAARTDAKDVASMLPPEDLRPLSWASQLDDLLTTTIDDTQAAAEIAALEAEAAAIKGAIVAPAGFSFTLTSRDEELQIRVTNSGPTALDVVVVPSSPRLQFPEGPQQVTVPAEDSVLVPIAVSTRTNGTSSAFINLRTPLGTELTPPVVLTAHVRAFTGLGQLVTGGALLVLLTWWASHLRANRRARRLRFGAAGHSAADTELDMSPDAAEAAIAPPADKAATTTPADEVDDDHG
ncbi:MAG: hypothetical protein M3Q72_14095, partial [Actinomycetota bacterium]|nr:hypothetical protein [Actinomycetota bacterium]